MPSIRLTRSPRTEAQPSLDAMGLDCPGTQQNVKLEGKRTSLRMRQVEWRALLEIARREGRQVSDVVSEVDRRRGDACLAGALRVFSVAYFWHAAQASEEVRGEQSPPVLMPLGA